MVDKNSLEFKAINLSRWAQQIDIAKQDNQEYLRKKGSQTIYLKTNEGYSCLDCNNEILSVDRIHSVHDGIFPLNGSGDVQHEPIPYCPKCEDKPNDVGGFITPEMDPNHREYSFF